MNTYIVPIFYEDTLTCRVKKYAALSEEHCQEKIMIEFEDKSDCDNYNDFIDELWQDWGICIGDIQDIDTI